MRNPYSRCNGIIALGIWEMLLNVAETCSMTPTCVSPTPDVALLLRLGQFETQLRPLVIPQVSQKHVAWLRTVKHRHA